MVSKKKPFMIRPDSWLRDLIVRDSELHYRDYSEQIVMILEKHYAEEKKKASLFEGQEPLKKSKEIPVFGKPLPGQDHQSKDQPADRRRKIQ